MTAGAPGPVPLNWLEPAGLYRRRRDFRKRNPQYLSEEEVTALAVPAPRVPPRRIARLLNGFASVPVVVLLIALAGIGFGCALLVLLGWARFGSPVEGALPVTLIAAVGLSIGAFAALWHWRITDRLLRRGTLVTGRITDVTRTGWQRSTGRRPTRRSVTGGRRVVVHPAYIQDQYRVTFSWHHTFPPSGGAAGVGAPGLDVATGSYTATRSIWGHDGDIAERYLKDGARVTLLVDPENTRRVLWLEVLRGTPL